MSTILEACAPVGRGLRYAIPLGYDFHMHAYDDRDHSVILDPTRVRPGTTNNGCVVYWLVSEVR